MNIKEIKHIVIRHKGDSYYEEVRLLKEDIDFFNLYLRRNKKSDFVFRVNVSQLGSRFAFDDIWKAYGYGEAYIEEVYAIFMLTKMLMIDLYEGNGTFTDKEIFDFIEWLASDIEINFSDYVGDFVGCSQGVLETKKKIDYITKKYISERVSRAFEEKEE